MRTSRTETLYQRIVRRLHDNPVAAVALVGVAVIVGAGSLVTALQSTRDYVQTAVLGRSPALRSEYCQLLRPLIVELDRTKAAFQRWNQQDLSIESETIRDGNLRARTLLREKAGLVPESLRDDQKKLIDHYDQWLEEYDRVRVRRTKDADSPFVFVYSFPQDSEQHFRARLAEVEAMLGSAEQCTDGAG